MAGFRHTFDSGHALAQYDWIILIIFQLILLIALLATPIFAQEIIIKTNPLKTELVLEIVKKITNQEFDLCKKNSMTHALNIKTKDLDQVINEICNQSDPKLLASKNGNSYKIIKDKTKQIAEEKLMEKKLAEIEDRVFEIYYLDMDEILNKKLNDFWKAVTQDDKDAFLIINSEEKIIIARGKKNKVEELAKFLESIDRPRKDVKLDIYFLTVNPQYELNLGINWSGIYNRLSTIQAKNQNFGFVGMGGTLYDIPTPTSPVIGAGQYQLLTFGNLFVDPTNYAINLIDLSLSRDAFLAQPIEIPIVFGGSNLNTRRLNAVLAASESETKLKIERSLSIIVGDNKFAKVVTGYSTPYYTAISQSIDSSGTQSNPQNTSALVYRDIGISAQINVNIINSNKINLGILIEHSRIISDFFPIDAALFSFEYTFDGYLVVPPTINVEKSSTNIILENEQSAIIFNYSDQTLQRTNKYIPFLQKIPFIGKFFKSMQNQVDINKKIMIISATIIE